MVVIMNELNEKLINVRNTVFKDDKAVKAHTLRLPLDLTAQLDALVEYSNKPKNTIVSEILDLGLTYFISSLDTHEKFELSQLYDLHKEQLMVDAMRDN